jgi:hypothetical protein
MRCVISHLGRRPDLRRNFARLSRREIEPRELIPTRAMLGWVASALMRGRLDVARGFLAAGKQLAAEQQQLAARHALLERAREQLERAPHTRTPHAHASRRRAVLSA